VTRIALATAAALPKLDEDGPLLLGALAERGLTGEPAVWDDPTVDWASFGLVVVRSTWDYARRRSEFLEWARMVDQVTRLANPLEVLAWNTDKRYLRELASVGLPVVPTTWLEPGDPTELPSSGEYVVKPAVSAGARDTNRYRPGDDAAAVAHIERLQREGRTVMVQPYLPGVDTRGETALLHLGGRYSHAVRKGPMLHPGDGPVAGLYREEDIRPRIANGAERSVAERVLAAVPRMTDLLYARVDLVPGSDGEPVLIEVELTEPSLFLSHAEGAARQLGDAIAALI
jgi:glutathione synthase/RimK-type ligase-like ATP-grasp enzyme